MRRLYILITVGLLCGCQGTGPAKIDNPVVGPPPPRLPPERIRENQLASGQPGDSAAASVADRRASRTSDSGSARVRIDDEEPSRQFAAKSIDDVPTGASTIRRVSLETTKDQDLPKFDDSMVVAMVNDQPVFAGEVLGTARPQLRAAEEQLKKQYGKEYRPEMLNRLRAMYLQAFLPNVVETKMLIQGAKAHFKKNQFEGLTKSIDEEWTAQVQQMMEKSNVTSVNELEALLKEQDFDMQEHATKFKNQKIAMNFVGFKAHSKYEPTRKEMLAYYEERRAEYEYPSRVLWQQLAVNDEDNGGPAGSKKLVQKIVQELLDGADFGETVKKYGNGPKAASKGMWDWTLKDSLANKDVDRELFTLPVGEMSGVIKTPAGYQIVLVLDRQDAGCKSFESLQKEIEAQMKKEDFESRAKKFVSDLKASTVITTIFDGEAPADETAEKPSAPKSPAKPGRVI